MKIFSTLLLLVVSAFYQTTKGAEQLLPHKKGVTIKIILDTAIKDVPNLVIYNTTFYAEPLQNNDLVVIKPQSIKGTTYYYSMPYQQRVTYFCITYSKMQKKFRMVDYLFSEPGDRITINIRQSKTLNEFELKFSGTGSAKYNCKTEFIKSIREEREVMFKDPTDKDLKDNYRRQLRYIKVCEAKIKQYRPRMSDFAAQLLHADIVGELGTTMARDVFGEYSMYIKNIDDIGDQKVTADYFNRYRLIDVADVADSILAFSAKYPHYRYELIKTERAITKGMANQVQYLSAMKEIDNTALRDKVITDYLVHGWIGLGPDIDKRLKDFLEIVQDKRSRDKIAEFTRHLPGSKAFQFSLTDQNGKTVRLEDFKGKVVFIDFYYTGCSNCISYFKWVVKDTEKKYSADRNIVFLSISIDTDLTKWKEGLRVGQYNSNDGINLYTNGEGSQHELIRYYNIKGYPSPMLIDKNGQIVHSGSYLRDSTNLMKDIELSLAK